MLRNPIFGTRPFDEIILHVGLHKTASTSIQRTCRINRARLKRQGDFYPLFKMPMPPFKVLKRPVHNHSHIFCSLFCDDPDDYSFNKRWNVSGAKTNRTYARQLERACRSNHDRLLISGEGISLIERHHLERLANYMQKFTKRLRVLAFVRHPLEWSESASQQRVKNGGMLSRIASPGQLKARIENLIEVFGDRMEFENFETARHCEFGLVGYFFDRIGIDHRKFIHVHTSRFNEGISAEAVRLLSLIHEKYEQSSFRVRKHAHTPRNNPILSLPGAKFRFHREEVEAIHDELVEVIHWLNGRFGFSYAVPDMRADRTRDEWNASTLEALDGILSRTRERHIRRAAAECLSAAASGICEADREKADNLRIFASSIAKDIPVSDAACEV